ncbi:DUF3014 domain-containing protein [Paraferrimonas sp. SM1919]|uniref:DUF3014 domain-containing protein n=1 Tax=Paraferrimonas sp. SM1919 TaxID=2662263 RepID=UPI0013D28DC2|nr:DUF3014 domain-containing protein [Paraferrimonas sp. SM1919]
MTEEIKSNNKTTIMLAIVATIAVIIAATVLFHEEPEPEPAIIIAPETPLEVEAVVEAEPEPELIEEPVVEVAPVVAPEPVLEPKPQPEAVITLDESDDYTKQVIAAAVDGLALDNYLSHSIVRKFVVFVDNTAQGELAQNLSPISNPRGKFSVIETSSAIFLDETSYRRYDFYAQLIEQFDQQALAKSYSKLEPLLIEAYAELGYEDRTFKQSLNNAINLLLKTPVVEGPVELISHSVAYKFADPELEQLEPVQKVLIRMGPENRAKFEAGLKRLQDVINNQ